MLNLSIVVPTLNRRDILTKTLPRLLNQDVPNGIYEVVVVSDGSTDGTVDFVRSLRSPVPLRVLDRPHLGASSARNAGIEAAHGELVLLLDDDMLCESTLVGRHLARHQDGSPSIVIGSVLTSSESYPGFACEFTKQAHRLYHDAIARGETGAVQWLSNNFSAPRKLLLSHGGYDERFTYSEDHEFAIRLWNAGVSFKFLYDEPVYEIYTKGTEHVVNSDSPRLGSSDVQLSRKHPGYRRESVPASILGETRVKLMMWWLCCVIPVSPGKTLRIPCSLAERLRSNPQIEKFGIRLLHYRKAIAIMRGAMGEVGSWKGLRREFGIRLPVLRYTRLGSVKKFEAHVRWLARRGYKGIAAADWVAWVEKGMPLPERPILFMFEGADSKLADHALPVLRRYGFRALVFVDIAQPGSKPEDDGELRQAGRRRWAPSQLQYWANEGIEFGIQNRTSPRRIQIVGDKLADQIKRGTEELAQRLGRRPIAFAYQAGSISGDLLDQVRRSFEIAFGDASGLNALSTDLHLMRTTEIKPSDRIFKLASAVHFGRSALKLRRPKFVTAGASIGLPEAQSYKA